MKKPNSNQLGFFIGERGEGFPPARDSPLSPALSSRPNHSSGASHCRCTKKTSPYSDRTVGVRPLIQLDTIKRHALFSDKRLRDRFVTVDLRLSVLLADGSAGSLPGLHQRSLNTEAKKQPDRMRQHPG
ncbi:hypothetical protein KSS91_10270 [Pseudomonas azerbaijanorientalis]|nr:hypothetical protein KSS91_10270 [Pseudomonas azerbaijanorientalis]